MSDVLVTTAWRQYERIRFQPTLFSVDQFRLAIQYREAVSRAAFGLKGSKLPLGAYYVLTRPE